MLLLALACFTPPTLPERCARCEDPAGDCAPADARACGALAEFARIAEPVDVTSAVLYADRACTHGDGLGCSALGLRYLDGLGLPDDDARALTLFTSECELGAGVVALAAPVHPIGVQGVSVGTWLPTAWGWGLSSAAIHEYLGMLKP